MNNLRVLFITTAIVGLLTVGAIWMYYGARAGSGTIVLPGGSTYLGPSHE